MTMISNDCLGVRLEGVVLIGLVGQADCSD